MKKEVKAIIAVVLAVWIFLMGIEVGAMREKKRAAAASSNVTTTQAPQTTEPTTTQPVQQTQPTTTQPNTPVVNPSTPDSAATPGSDTSVDVSALSKEQILAKVSEGVNKIKSEQNMTAHKTENVTVNLTALSVESLRSLVNSIISNLVGDPVDQTITVANGIATYPDGSTKPIKEAIPPSNDTTKDFALTAAGVASATATKQGENTVYSVVLVAETTTGTNPIPTHNSVAIGYLNIMSFNDDLPSGAQIVDANMSYPGSTVEITVNPAGQVIKFVNKMPMKGDGTAKIAFAEGKAEFEGELNEVWEFTY